ncbi:MAG: anhydro-N-acetylmuramic acid kinase [Pseudomonadota bacterium]
MAGELYLGLISGTSMDGIDAALVDFKGDRPVLMQGGSFPYDDDLRAALGRLSRGEALAPAALSQVDVAVGQSFAGAVQAVLQAAAVAPQEVIALGSHGQNVYHGPDDSPASTWQLGNPHVIATCTGIATVADFRRRDVALGGQGAPLAPALHGALLRSTEESRAVLNLGGIGNLTLLPADLAASIAGFDTGPGNCLLDDWIAAHRSEPLDKNGEWAASGRVLQPLLDRMLTDPYFDRLPPKSTGREHFHLRWIESFAGSDDRPEDVQATLAALTAESVARALRQQQPDCRRVLVCGGGAHNPHLMARLEFVLQPIPVAPTSRFGVHGDWMEAMLFAHLARFAVQGRKSDLESVTGAAPHVYGVVYPA